MKKTYIALSVCVVVLFIGARVPLALAQSTTYWCGSYYSASPCGYGYNNNYNYNYGYTNPYYNNNSYPSYAYQYPSNYYPNMYNSNYTYTYPRPSCTMTTTQGNNGYWNNGYQNVILSWSSSNATSAYISPSIGSVSTYGSVAVYPQGNYVYTMTVYGPGGSDTCQTSYYQPNYYYPQNNNYSYPYLYSQNYYGYNW